MCVCIIVKEPGADMVVIEIIISKNNTTPAGFEPARAEPNRFQVCRLNHSAIVPKTMQVI